MADDLCKMFITPVYLRIVGLDYPIPVNTSWQSMKPDSRNICCWADRLKWAQNGVYKLSYVSRNTLFPSLESPGLGVKPMLKRVPNNFSFFYKHFQLCKSSV